MSHFIERTGHCYDKYTDFLGCALEPDECELREGWDYFRPKTEGRCDANNFSIGRCIKENTCALRASDCGEDSNSNFKEKDDHCTIQRDRALEWDSDNPSYTQFGSCKNSETGSYFCIFDPSDCDELGTETYVIPEATLAAGIICDCSEVHVTSCENNLNSGDIMCAIKGESCAEEYFPTSPIAQRTNREFNGSDLDCRLCRKVNTLSPTPAPNPTASSGGAHLRFSGDSYHVLTSLVILLVLKCIL